jgi:nitric oxide dioxygenase
MNAEEISVVRSSFAQVLPHGLEAAALFYGRLFRIAPELKAVFGPDLPALAPRTVAGLSYMVAALDRPEDVAVFVAELAALLDLHRGFDAGLGHYERAGEALLWTLRQVLGPACTRKVVTAWASAFGRLAGAMIETGYDDAIAA